MITIKIIRYNIIWWLLKLLSIILYIIIIQNNMHKTRVWKLFILTLPSRYLPLTNTTSRPIPNQGTTLYYNIGHRPKYIIPMSDIGIGKQVNMEYMNILYYNIIILRVDAILPRLSNTVIAMNILTSRCCLKTNAKNILCTAKTSAQNSCFGCCSISLQVANGVKMT